MATFVEEGIIYLKSNISLSLKTNEKKRKM